MPTNEYHEPGPTRHPPLNSDEKFLGNTESNELPEHLKHIVGLRLATPAYDLNGEELPGYYAMIANPSAAEQYSRIMEARLSAIRARKPVPTS